jgi:catecholate siderophore receptor
VALVLLAGAALAALSGTALAQTAATASTLKEVTVSADEEKGYSPSYSSTATKGSAPLRDVPQAVNVLPSSCCATRAPCRCRTRCATCRA